MKTLRQDHYLRAQKQRKQELYRQMLDQQIRYKNQSKQENRNSPQHTSNDRRYIASNQYGEQPELIHSNHLPHIGNQYLLKHDRQENHNQKDKSFDEEDRAQIYLSNCQQIIKNLRDLKEKKKYKKSNYRYQISPAVNKANSVDVQYYPKPNYFSSGHPYNKVTPIESNQKSFKLRPSKLKTLEVDSKHEKSSPSKLSYSSIRSKRSKNRRIVSQDKRSVDQKQHQNKGKLKKLLQKQLQSPEPSGILQQHQSSNKHSKRKANLIKVLPPAYEDQLNERNEQQQAIKKQIKQNINQEQNKRYKQQLSLCLNQLTKYLKIKNNQTEKNINFNNNNPDQLQNLQIQQSRSHNLQEKTQDQTENALIKLNQSKISDLKHKVMAILHKLNKQSQQLVNKMSQNKKYEENNSEELGKKQVKIFQQDQSQNQQSLQKQQKQKNHINIVNQPKVGEAIQKQKANELVEIMKDHLNKQDSNDEDFTRCVKEMTQYLKNQRQQKKQFGNEDGISISESKLMEYQKDNQSINHQKQAQLNIKDNSTKLQEAVLRRLKKARMRGSIFQEKVQNFRKQHNMHFKKPNLQQINSVTNDPLGDNVPSQSRQKLNLYQSTHNTTDHFQ